MRTATDCRGGRFRGTIKTQKWRLGPEWRPKSFRYEIERLYVGFGGGWQSCSYKTGDWMLFKHEAKDQLREELAKLRCPYKVK